MDVEASSMKITSVDFEIMALLNTLCLVVVAMFVWCTSPRMGWNRLVLPLFASPMRHGTLSLWHFLLKLRSFRKSSQNSPISTSERLFSKISLKYLGSGSLPGSYVVKTLGEMMPIFSSGIGFFTKRLSLNGPAVSAVNLDEIVVDGNWMYHLAVWVREYVNYLSHVLSSLALKNSFAARLSTKTRSSHL